MRKVVTYNTLGDNSKEFNSSAKTWGELQSDLRINGVPFDDMRVMIGETQVSLESSQAILPDEDITLFIMPHKVKSGHDDDDSFIDSDCGVSWKSEDWGEVSNIPEDYLFKTEDDLAMARLKKAMWYLEEASNVLGNVKNEASPGKTEGSKMIKSLRDQARLMQNSIDMFG